MSLLKKLEIFHAPRCMHRMLRLADDVTLHTSDVNRCVHKMLLRIYVLRCTQKILHLTRLMHTFAHTEWYASHIVTTTAHTTLDSIYVHLGACTLCSA